MSDIELKGNQVKILNGPATVNGEDFFNMPLDNTGKEKKIL